MLHSLPLFLKLFTYLVGFELTPADLLPVDSNTLPLSHGRLGTCIIICIFIFKYSLKFLNSEYYCLQFHNTLHYISSDIVNFKIMYYYINSMINGE